ncbi:PVC-type heme-binding CxxCH protein [uncultured Rubinisphaera sp.]|uniref:PVC-type heme-binding CxxCH protein n=1 Tax=uncultured Rubinisphaera sp. TaxID=1678686 RepID=UPI0030DD8E6C
MQRLTILAITIISIGFFAAPIIQAGPLSTDDAKQSFELREGYQLSLVASEPEVIDPVAMAFDETGRLWVVEMRDYPNGPSEGEPGKSRIKVLRDKDGDGYYETAVTFADNLLFATGILPWKGGVIVTLSGKVEYFKDTNGDDKFDERETWLEGFAQENPQLRANHPTLGPDGFIYVANGLRGGSVTSVRADWPQLTEPIELRGKDFRFDPHTGMCESIAGNGQFGMSFDQWGNRLICSNRNPCMQVMLSYDQLERQPRAVIKSLVHDVSPSGVDSKLSALTGNWTTSNLHQGQFTAACGVLSSQSHQLRDISLYPNEDPGLKNAFIYACDPTANIIHRDQISYSGSTFAAVQPHQENEFLASRDEWFRPVNVKIGPDGSLFVADMYRAVIEHPQFMPDELKKRPDLTLGNDRGRIWKIKTVKSVSEDFSIKNVLSQDEFKRHLILLEWLNSKSEWKRDTAFRIIIENQDDGFLKTTERWITEQSSGEQFLVAIRLQRYFHQLKEHHLLTGLKHKDPRVLKETLGMISDFQNQKDSEFSDAKLLPAVLKCLKDVHGPVRYEALLALQNFSVDDLEIMPSVVDSVVKYNSDSWSVLATLLLFNSEQLVDLLNTVLNSNVEVVQKVSYAQQIAELIGRINQPEQVDAVLVILFQQTPPRSNSEISPVLSGLGSGLKSRGVVLSKLISTFINKPDHKLAAQQIASFTEELISPFSQTDDQTQQVRESSLNDKVSIISLLEYLPAGTTRGVLDPLIEDPTLPVDLRIAALNSLAGGDHTITQEQTENLVDLIRSETPAMRRELIEFCLKSTARTLMLLKTIEQGKLKFRELAGDQQTRIARSRDQQVSALYNKLKSSQTESNRDAVLAAYLSSLEQQKLDRPAAVRGHELFKQHCAICHQIGTDGVRVGPDISDTRTKRSDELLTSILDPNRAIDNNYFSYTAVTAEGKIATGILAEETPYSITLKQAKGTTISLQREEIDEFASDGVSFMPQQFEKNISKEQMADLISYLKNWRYLEQGVPFVE